MGERAAPAALHSAANCTSAAGGWVDWGSFRGKRRAGLGARSYRYREALGRVIPET